MSVGSGPTARRTGSWRPSVGSVPSSPCATTWSAHVCARCNCYSLFFAVKDSGPGRGRWRTSPSALMRSTRHSGSASSSRRFVSSWRSSIASWPNWIGRWWRSSGTTPGRAAVHSARHRPGHRGGLRLHLGRHFPLRWSTQGSGLHRPRTLGVQLRGAPAKRGHHEDGQYPTPVALDRGRVVDHALVEPEHRRVTPLDPEHRPAAWPAHRHRRTGAQAGGDPVRDVARWHHVRRETGHGPRRGRTNRLSKVPGNTRRSSRRGG